MGGGLTSKSSGKEETTKCLDMMGDNGASGHQPCIVQHLSDLKFFPVEPEIATAIVGLDGLGQLAPHSIVQTHLKLEITNDTQILPLT